MGHPSRNAVAQTYLRTKNYPTLAKRRRTWGTLRTAKAIFKLAASYGVLLTALEILHGERAAAHFVLANKNCVFGAQFFSVFKAFFNSETLVSHIDDQPGAAEFSRQFQGVAVHARAERNDVGHGCLDDAGGL